MKRYAKQLSHETSKSVIKPIKYLKQDRVKIMRLFKSDKDLTPKQSLYNHQDVDSENEHESGI